MDIAVLGIDLGKNSCSMVGRKAAPNCGFGSPSFCGEAAGN
jgi:hypothetical protein